MWLNTRPIICWTKRRNQHEIVDIQAWRGYLDTVMSKARRVDTKDEISLSKPGLGTDISSVKIAYLSMG